MALLFRDSYEHVVYQITYECSVDAGGMGGWSGLFMSADARGSGKAGSRGLLDFGASRALDCRKRKRKRIRRKGNIYFCAFSTVDVGEIFHFFISRGGHARLYNPHTSYGGWA